MQRIIIGTAGHVDHGKSTLVKALTGVDPDRLPEEKARQMSIDLGFVFLPITETEEVAIIDVPGHEQFLKTMIAGANSIRLVLFIVAADEGIMPQTIEHFDVLKLMGVEKGIIVITKTDKTVPNYLSLLEEDIRDHVKDSFLQDAPICRVSTVNEAGLEDLRITIRNLCQAMKPFPQAGIFRCPIDRIFTIKGFGTIVAGTVLSGRLKISDRVEVLPIKKTSRLRNLQVHKKSVDEVFAGQRVAFNLMDITVKELVRGYELSEPDYLVPTQIVNGSVSVLPNIARPLINNERVRLHKGTGEIMARVIILDKEKIEPGDRGYVQFRLEKPIVGERMERLIIRSYSPMRVIGGGQFLEVYAKKGGRFKSDKIDYLCKLERIEKDKLIETVIKNAPSPILHEKELMRITNMPLVIINQHLQVLQSQKQLTRLKDNSIIHCNTVEELKIKFLDAISKYIKANPIKVFLSIGELKKITQVTNHFLCQMLIEELRKEGKIELSSDGVKLIDMDVKISPVTQKLLDEIENLALRKGYQLIRQTDLINQFPNEGQDRLKNLLGYLLKTGRFLEIREGAYLHHKMIDEAKTKLINYLETKGTVRAIEFRELLGVSRDLARDILDYFLKEGITVRTEGTHRLKDG